MLDVVFLCMQLAAIAVSLSCPKDVWAPGVGWHKVEVLSQLYVGCAPAKELSGELVHRTRPEMVAFAILAAKEICK